MSLKERLRGIVAAVATAALAISVAPVTAMANPGDAWTGTETGSIVINGSGFDTTDVHVYKVADITRTTTNETKLDPVTGLEDEVNAWKDDNSASKAADIASAVATNGLPDLTTSESDRVTVSANTDPAGVTISPVRAGVYYVSIDDSDTTAFQNIVVALTPEAQTDGTWKIGTATVENVKSSPKQITKKIVSVDGSNGYTPGTDGIYEAGDVVKYRVDFSVGKNMSEFHLDDKMSAGLEFDKNILDLQVFAGSEKLTAGVDYNLVTENLPEGVTFRVEFTTTGIANAGDKTGVYMTYCAKISEDASTTTASGNTVSSSVNPGGSTADIKYAGISVTKYETGNTEKKLQGAVFGLYSDKACTKLIESATTDENGFAQFASLLYSKNTYYVKEISAPAGYKSSDRVYTFGPLQEYRLQDSRVTNLNVSNDQLTTSEGFNLPQTGGPGTIALTVVGVGLIAGAAAWAVRSRKEN